MGKNEYLTVKSICTGELIKNVNFRQREAVTYLRLFSTHKKVKRFIYKWQSMFILKHVNDHFYIIICIYYLDIDNRSITC